MSAILQDLRHGVRLLFRAPAFTAVAVVALAIGIGANTAIFSVVNTLVLQPLPYKDADRLAVVWEHNIPRDKKNNVVSPGNFLHWREMNQTFEDIAAVGLTFTITATGDGEPEELPMQYVTAAFFPVVGVQPQLGRPFTAEEDKPNSRVVVISDRLWKRRFHGDPAILARPITLAGRSPHRGRRDAAGILVPRQDGRCVAAARVHRGDAHAARPLASGRRPAETWRHVHARAGRHDAGGGRPHEAVSRISTRAGRRASCHSASN